MKGIWLWFEDSHEAELIKAAIGVLVFAEEHMDFKLKVGDTEDAEGLESAHKELIRIIRELKDLVDM